MRRALDVARRRGQNLSVGIPEGHGGENFYKNKRCRCPHCTLGSSKARAARRQRAKLREAGMTQTALADNVQRQLFSLDAKIKQAHAAKDHATVDKLLDERLKVSSWAEEVAEAMTR